jgi:hypothetical protein
MLLTASGGAIPASTKVLPVTQMIGRAGVTDMTDPDRPSEEPTTRQRMKALLVVGLGAILTTVFLIWFAFTFLFQTCCVSPTPGP